MNITEYKGILENIVHDSLYVLDRHSDKQEEYLNEMIKYLSQSEDYFNDFRILISSRSNENYFAYNEYIERFLVSASYEIKEEVLSNYDNYDDIIRDNDIYLSIWKSFNSEHKINYLKNKKKFSDLDYKLINWCLLDSNSFTDNVLLHELADNEELRNRIDCNSIEVNCSQQYLNYFDLSNYEQCKILTKESYTALLLKKCTKFEDFINIYNKDNNIFKLLQSNSLKFNSKFNNEIYEFILSNYDFIGKFSKRYLSLFNILEMTKISKNTKLDSDSYSTVMERMYKFDNEKAMEYFSVDNLRKFSKHSISVNPFHNFNDKFRETLFNDYSLFNKFMDPIMIEVINNYFKEDDILNLLRNDEFVNDTSSYAMELMLNKLSFKSTFNMLQRKNILAKVSNLNVSVNEKDSIFIKGYLESPLLINKSEHSFIYNMLSLLNEDDVSYFITLPYINNKLSNYEIINLCLNKNISIEEVIFSETLRDKLNTIDIISFIDKYFENKLDLSIFNNKELVKLIFNLSDNQISKIDFNEVNYLYETIRMKSILSKQNCKCTVQSYKAVLAAYMVFGLTDTIKLVMDGNSSITLDEVKDLQNYVVNARILEFKQNNSSIFQNIAKKIIERLSEFKKDIDIKILEKEIRKNTYLDNVIYLMLENNYDNYNDIISVFYSYVKYRHINEYQAKREIYDYCKAFIEMFLDNKVKEYNTEFENIILKNFKPKESVIYSKRKEIGRNYIQRLKLKLFIRSLTDPDKELYKEFFRDGYDLDNVKSKYVNYLSNTEIEFENILEHVLIPLSNNRFDSFNCLNKLGISKPSSYDQYYKYMDDIRTVTMLNNEIEKIESLYSHEDLISIMNYICYGSKLNIKMKAKDKKHLSKLASMVDSLSGELYVDKSTLRYLYKDNMDIYNIDEIIEYKNYIDILEDIVTRTYNYINRHMDNEKIKKYYAHDYFRAMNTEKCVFPISNRYYEPQKRVFGLCDMELLFNGYDLSNSKKVSKSLENFLRKKKNLVMLLDGYYGDLINNMGVIISKWDMLVNEAKELDLDINDVNLITLENILSMESFKDNVLGRILDKDVIKVICDNSHYEELNLNKRIDMLIDLYHDSFNRVTSTVPYITYVDNEYTVEVMDGYDQDTYKYPTTSNYKIGSIGNDFLHYAILNKNGIVINIYNNDELVAKVLGVRNGNAVYLNGIEGIYDENYVSLLKGFANKLIDVTKDDVESIEFVTIVNNGLYDDQNGYRIDNVLCPVINNPINVMYIDYDVFKENKNLISDEIYTNYSDHISTLLANSAVVDKNSFKYYDADDKYYRRRSNVIKLSNNIGEDYLNRIDAILYLWYKNVSDDVDDKTISLSSYDTIYLGDDFVLFNKDNEVIQYVLNYDTRAEEEIKLIIDSIN